MIIDFDMWAAWTVIAFFVVAFLLLILLLRRLWKMSQITFTVNIVITPAAVPLSAVTDPLQLNGKVGDPFTTDLSSNLQGGKPPFSVSIAGTPPSGLSVNGSVISGTPTSEGTTTLSVTASDSQ